MHVVERASGTVLSLTYGESDERQFFKLDARGGSACGGC
jgi:hypothetical protein